jgi:hypothetical protein
MKPCRQRFREFSKHSQPRISDLVPQCYAFRKGGVDYFVSLDALVKGDRKLLEELWEHRVVYPTK